jgi:hypothetical protein
MGEKSQERMMEDMPCRGEEVGRLGRKRQYWKGATPQPEPSTVRQGSSQV